MIMIIKFYIIWISLLTQTQNGFKNGRCNVPVHKPSLRPWHSSEIAKNGHYSTSTVLYYTCVECSLCSKAKIKTVQFLQKDYDAFLHSSVTHRCYVIHCRKHNCTVYSNTLLYVKL